MDGRNVVRCSGAVCCCMQVEGRRAEETLVHNEQKIQQFETTNAAFYSNNKYLNKFIIIRRLLVLVLTLTDAGG